MTESVPIFVVGVPRSGTTLLASLLGAHPSIHAGPETHFFEDFDLRPPPPPSRDSHWPVQGARWLMEIQHVGGSVPSNAGLTEEDLVGYLASVPPSYRAMLESLTVLQMRRAGKTRWLEKTPNHIVHLPSLRRIFPEAIIIRVMRDPRDTIGSLMNVPWGPKTLPAAISLFWDNYAPGEAFARIDKRMITVRWEDLLIDPATTLAYVGQNVGDTLDPNADLTQSGAEVNRTREPWKAKASQPIDKSRREVWRTAMSFNDQRLVEGVLGHVIDQHDYPRTIFSRGQWFRVMPIRSIDTCPQLVQLWKSGQQTDTDPSHLLIIGDPDPQKVLDRAHGSRVAMLIELIGRLILWRCSGTKVRWWTEPANPQGGQLSRIISFLLAKRRVGPVSSPAEPSQ